MLSALLRRLGRDRRGVSAVEFALIAPVLAVFLGGAVELSGAVTASNRATFVTDTIAEMVSRSSHTLTQAELKNFAVMSSLVDTDILRYARLSNKAVEASFAVTISSVQFDKVLATCTLNCVYAATTVFSYTLNGTKRPCGVLTASNGSSNSMSSLQADVFAPGSLIVVDTQITYRSIMPIRIKPDITYKRTSYFRPRYVSRINSDSNCLGY